MNRLRAYHTATLLPDGKVLIAGGLGQGTGNKNQPGVQPGNQYLLGAPRYGRISRISHPPRYFATGKVLVAGGTTSAGPAESTVEIYDPASDTWSAGGRMAGGAREPHRHIDAR